MLKLEGAHASANSVSKDLENMSRGALRGNTRAKEAHKEFFPVSRTKMHNRSVCLGLWRCHNQV